jgi:hypothetical protein
VHPGIESGWLSYLRIGLIMKISTGIYSSLPFVILGSETLNENSFGSMIAWC